MAGGGTGDASTLLGKQLRAGGIGGEIVYLDLSRTARGIAEERARAAGLDNVRFLTGSPLDLTGLDLGAFHYINCSGVLHHLEDPAEGMAALASVLAPGGADEFCETWRALYDVLNGATALVLARPRR